MSEAVGWPMPDTNLIRTLTLDTAQRILAKALTTASELRVAVCIFVSGRDGTQVLAARMDGAPLLSVKLAADKAWTVAAFNGLPTHEWWGLIESEPALVHGITKVDRLIIFGGGVPVLQDGEFVGAVGVSGGSAAEDRMIAEAGARAICGSAPNAGAASDPC